MVQGLVGFLASSNHWVEYGVGYWHRGKKFLKDPHTAKRIHGWGTILWLLASPFICIYLKDSVPTLVFISVYANVVGHWSGYQGVLAEESGNSSPESYEPSK